MDAIVTKGPKVRGCQLRVHAKVLAAVLLSELECIFEGDEPHRNIHQWQQLFGLFVGECDDRNNQSKLVEDLVDERATVHTHTVFSLFFGKYP